jgi:hypothetical protein
MKYRQLKKKNRRMRNRIKRLKGKGEGGPGGAPPTQIPPFDQPGWRDGPGQGPTKPPILTPPRQPWYQQPGQWQQPPNQKPWRTPPAPGQGPPPNQKPWRTPPAPGKGRQGPGSWLEPGSQWKGWQEAQGAQGIPKSWEL